MVRDSAAKKQTRACCSLVRSTCAIDRARLARSAGGRAFLASESGARSSIELGFFGMLNATHAARCFSGRNRYFAEADARDATALQYHLKFESGYERRLRPKNGRDHGAEWAPTMISEWQRRKLRLHDCSPLHPNVHQTFAIKHDAHEHTRNVR